MSASLDSPVVMDSFKCLLKQARRVLLGAVQLCRLAGQPRCWLEPEALTELAAAAAAALQATKDWAAACKTKQSKAQFGEVYILADKVCAACAFAVA